LGVSGDLLRTIAQEADLRGQMLARQTGLPLSHQGGMSAIEALAEKLDGSSERAADSME
jgi:hypothetical protein